MDRQIPTGKGRSHHAEVVEAGANLQLAGEASSVAPCLGSASPVGDELAAVLRLD